jgi:hypothetical protein
LLGIQNVGGNNQPLSGQVLSANRAVNKDEMSASSRKAKTVVCGAEHGFSWRATAGISTIGDRERLEAGEEPLPGALPPPRGSTSSSRRAS